MLLRKYCYRNDMPERSGKRDIIAQRYGNLYRLKFIWYTEDNVYVRLYALSQDKFVALVTYYGKQLFHSRLFDEYLITSNRNIYRLWVGKLGHKVNLYATAPNMTYHAVSGNYKKLQKHAESRVEWKIEFDTNGNRWLVTQFLIHKNRLSLGE